MRGLLQRQVLSVDLQRRSPIGSAWNDDPADASDDVPTSSQNCDHGGEKGL
jgi:hypothetical protein